MDPAVVDLNDEHIVQLLDVFGSAWKIPVGKEDTFELAASCTSSVLLASQAPPRCSREGC